jgi:hypothetical protein
MSMSLSIIFIGIGATAVTDLWGLARKKLFDIPPPNFGMVGRWIGHMAHGEFRHSSIVKASPIIGERIIGWTTHYLTGIAFAALLVGIYGQSWIHKPTIGTALAFGIGTVAAPFLIMQPGMGASIAASKTPHPASARLQSLMTHAVFGFGLYVSCWVVQYSQTM